LTKQYGNFTAVDNLSFSVNKGEIFGIVGPNGAGKTTTLKMLSGLIRQNEGTIRIKGIDLEKEPVKIKSFLGFLPEDSPMYEAMRVEDYLMFFAELYGINRKTAHQRINTLLSDLSLEADGKKIGDLSKGMKRKVAIARSLINDPEVLIYDEPASGLDPMTSKYITDYIYSLKHTGKTIIFSAHNLYHVETLCDRILIMKSAKAIILGTIKDIQKKYGHTSYRVKFIVDDADGFTAAKIEKIDEYYLVTADDISVVNLTTAWVASKGGEIVELRTIELSLEEIFLELMEVDTGSGRREVSVNII
jgi:ABC-2 type transport system ATP-binding protein